MSVRRLGKLEGSKVSQNVGVEEERAPSHLEALKLCQCNFAWCRPSIGGRAPKQPGGRVIIVDCKRYVKRPGDLSPTSSAGHTAGSRPSLRNMQPLMGKCSRSETRADNESGQPG